MNPVRWLLLGAVITAVVALPALPVTEAQNMCPRNVSVTTMSMQNQKTQFFQQQQQQQKMQQQQKLVEQQHMMQQQKQQQQITYNAKQMNQVKLPPAPKPAVPQKVVTPPPRPVAVVQQKPLPLPKPVPVVQQKNITQQKTVVTQKAIPQPPKVVSVPVFKPQLPKLPTPVGAQPKPVVVAKAVPKVNLAKFAPQPPKIVTQRVTTQTTTQQKIVKQTQPAPQRPQIVQKPPTPALPVARPQNQVVKQPVAKPQPQANNLHVVKTTSRPQTQTVVQKTQLRQTKQVPTQQAVNVTKAKTTHEAKTTTMVKMDFSCIQCHQGLQKKTQPNLPQIVQRPQTFPQPVRPNPVVFFQPVPKPTVALPRPVVWPQPVVPVAFRPQALPQPLFLPQAPLPVAVARRPQPALPTFLPRPGELPAAFVRTPWTPLPEPVVRLPQEKPGLGLDTPVTPDLPLPLLTREQLAKAPELPRPVAVQPTQPPVGRIGVLNTGAVEREAKAAPVLAVTADDGLSRLPLPRLPNGVWRLPGVSGAVETPETIADEDAPLALPAAVEPAPVRTNVPAPAAVDHRRDGPALPALPLSVRPVG